MWKTFDLGYVNPAILLLWQVPVVAAGAVCPLSHLSVGPSQHRPIAPSHMPGVFPVILVICQALARALLTATDRRCCIWGFSALFFKLSK